MEKEKGVAAVGGEGGCVGRGGGAGLLLRRRRLSLAGCRAKAGILFRRVSGKRVAKTANMFVEEAAAPLFLRSRPLVGVMRRSKGGGSKSIGRVRAANSRLFGFSTTERRFC
ncbi:MAG: hypothetical protein LBG43_08195, partial [Treponema sp.]|nr:hypothetical protein [Treponema sp.]